MRHLRSLSLLMVVAGALLLAAGRFLPLGPAWVLTGLLLVWAGVVKMVVVQLWRGVANPERAIPDRSSGED